MNFFQLKHVIVVLVYIFSNYYELELSFFCILRKLNLLSFC